MTLGLVLLGLAVLAGLSVVLSTLTLGIGPLPSSRSARAAVLSLCSKEQAGTVYELGSGFGGLARALARHCPSAQVVGLEAATLPFVWAALVQRLFPLPNLRFRRADFRTLPLEPAGLLVCYLFTGAMAELARRSVPAKGQVLISSTFALPGHTPDATARADDLYGSKVYRYRG